MASNKRFLIVIVATFISTITTNAVSIASEDKPAEKLNQAHQEIEEILDETRERNKTFTTFLKAALFLDFNCTGLANGDYAYPSDCRKFITCSNQMAYLVDCAPTHPNDLLYYLPCSNSSTSRCGWEHEFLACCDFPGVPQGDNCPKC